MGWGLEGEGGGGRPARPTEEPVTTRRGNLSSEWFSWKTPLLRSRPTAYRQFLHRHSFLNFVEKKFWIFFSKIKQNREINQNGYGSTWTLLHRGRDQDPPPQVLGSIPRSGLAQTRLVLVLEHQGRDELEVDPAAEARLPDVHDQVVVDVLLVGVRLLLPGWIIIINVSTSCAATIGKPYNSSTISPSSIPVIDSLKKEANINFSSGSFEDKTNLQLRLKQLRKSSISCWEWTKKSVIIRVKPISSYIRHKEEAKIEANKKIILKRSLNSFCSPFLMFHLCCISLPLLYLYCKKSIEVLFLWKMK